MSYEVFKYLNDWAINTGNTVDIMMFTPCVETKTSIFLSIKDNAKMSLYVPYEDSSDLEKVKSYVLQLEEKSKAVA